MKLRTIQSIQQWRGKTVLLRVDFNIPLDANNNVDTRNDDRLTMALPTFRYLLSKKAKIVVITHLGRPGGRIIPSLRLDPVARRLSALLHKKVVKLNAVTGGMVTIKISSMKPGDVLMLENLRFDPREEKNSFSFAKILSRLADVYVNDAFSNSHRTHASMEAITRYLPSFAGLLLEKEVQTISSFVRHRKRPLTVLLGGSKISTKIQFVKTMLAFADFVLLGGAMANTVLYALGEKIGASKKEIFLAPAIKATLRNARNLYVPIDAVTINKNNPRARPRETLIQNIAKDEIIYDIGAKTIALYQQIIIQSKTLIWNGPMGFIEKKPFRSGTHQLLHTILALNTPSLIGGGELIKALRQHTGNASRHKLILSSGGGAMLEFIEKGTLTALVPLQQ